LERKAGESTNFSPNERALAASELYASLKLIGFDLLSKQEPSIEIDLELIDNLINQRLEARRNKNFAESDRIRDELLAMGIQLKDGKDPVTGDPTTTWEVKR